MTDQAKAPKVSIKIKDEGFQSSHLGYLKPDTVYLVEKGFAEFCVKKMKSAVYGK